MYLLVYRSWRQETTGGTSAEIYLGHDLRLPMDLLRGSPPSVAMKTGCYVKRLKERLAEIHQDARQRIDIRSKNMKAWLDRRARGVLFEPGVKTEGVVPQSSTENRKSSKTPQFMGKTF